MNTLADAIIENIKTTLSGATGFSSSTVRRWSQKGASYATVPCIDIKSEGYELIDSVNDIETNELIVAVDITHQVLVDNSEQAMDELVYSCLKSLMADPSRGGLALKTLKHSVEPISTVAGQPEVTQTIILKVIFRSSQKNPSQKK